MLRRRFSREFKLEAIKLVRERRGAAAPAARDQAVHKIFLQMGEGVWLRSCIGIASLSQLFGLAGSLSWKNAVC